VVKSQYSTCVEVIPVSETIHPDALWCELTIHCSSLFENEMCLSKKFGLLVVVQAIVSVPYCGKGQQLLLRQLFGLWDHNSVVWDNTECKQSSFLVHVEWYGDTRWFLFHVGV